jgi:hypothetical protein
MVVKLKYWTPVAYAYNPSHLGGRDLEDRDSKPAQAKFARPYPKKIQHKTGLVKWLKW